MQTPEIVKITHLEALNALSEMEARGEITVKAFISLTRILNEVCNGKFEEGLKEGVKIGKQSEAVMQALRNI